MADTKKYLEQYDDGNPNLDSELTDEQIEEIMPLVGNILFLFNSLETDLDRQIAETINGRSHQPGYTVTSELGAVFTKKVSVFKALYGPAVESLENESLSTEFESLWKTLYTVKDIRNEIAHADWLNGSASYEIRIKSSSDEGGPYAITRPMPPDYLKTKIENLEKATEKLEKFGEDFSEALQTHGT